MKTSNFLNKLMIVLLAVIVSCLFTQEAFAYSENAYFYDDFEVGLSKWKVGGDSWQVTDLFFRSASFSASESPHGNYTRNANSTMEMKRRYRINLSNSTQPILRFWHRISVQDGDYGYVEISQDGGFDWTTLTSFTNTYRSTWSRVQIDLSAYRSSSVLIRFRLRDNGDSRWANGPPKVAAGWDIDDVEICELDWTTIEFPMYENFHNKPYNWIYGDWGLSGYTT